MNNPFEEFEKPMVIEENNILANIDEFEEKLKTLNELSKQYDKLKKEVKEAMINVCEKNGAEKLKWITPKGIQITFSAGHKPEFEERKIKQFDLECLIKNYPEIYEKCIVDKIVNERVRDISYDRLTITMAKEK